MSAEPDTLSQPSSAPAAPHEVVLVTGISGSGKSVALHALEDAGGFCVDHLPPALLPTFTQLIVQHAGEAEAARKRAPHVRN